MLLIFISRPAPVVPRAGYKTLNTLIKRIKTHLNHRNWAGPENFHLVSQGQGKEVDAARKMIKRALVVPFDPGEHQRQFWCVCCRQEVKWHLSQGTLAVLHGGLLQHMASFKASLAKALDTYEEKEDEVIQEVAARIREIEQSRRQMVQAALEPQAETELCDGAAAAAVNTFAEILSDSAFAGEEQEQPGPCRSLIFLEEQPGCVHRTMPELAWLEAGQSLTFIGHQEAAGEGNIHTGAKPPWLMEEEGESKGQIGPSYEEFLKEKEKQKLKKLPPNRVGANFDHNSQTGEGWLPSFGRVWNHGRRWQSRHQFKSEAGQKLHGRKQKQPKPK
ncbi:centrosomal AT-AC splicing factor isoform X3 [Rhineura floridana]|uniref:centrosomal AT-AC splicing factor isoform X3 n=1 Tax=Rhineura floridana TaxID=261503 RepID=UPI002AC8170A|nr:centrosomal AT-AC splicing factor isoform X3 [Rhineura floridana]